MEKINSAFIRKIDIDQLRKFQKIYKTGLRWSVILLTEIFALWSLMQYYIEERDYLKYQKWIGVAILAGAIGYVVIAALTDKEELARIGAFLRSLCSFEQILLILMLLWYILGCAVRSRLDGEPLFKFNDNRLFMVCLYTFLFFPFVKLMGSRARRTLEYMIHLIMLIYTPFCAWCISKYYKVEFLTFPSGKRLENHREGVSMQMGGNINVIAAAAVILLGLCIYMILTQITAVKIIYLPVAVIYFAVVILTNSRTSYLAMLAMLVVSAVLFAWDILKSTEIPLRLVGVLIAALLCSVIVMSGRRALLQKFAHVYPESLQKETEQSPEEVLKEYVTGGQATSSGHGQATSGEQATSSGHGQATSGEQETSGEQATSEAVLSPSTATAAVGRAISEVVLSSTAAASAAPAAVGQAGPEVVLPSTATAPAVGRAGPEAILPLVSETDQTIESEDGTRKMDDLNGRKWVWIYAIQIIRSSKDHFLFGVSPCYVKSWLEKTSRFNREIPHAHNGLLQVGLGIGVPGMLIFLLFELAIIIRCLNIVFVRHGKPFKYSWIIPAVIMAILIIELVESMLFVFVRFNLPAFYILAGCSVEMSRRVEQKNM